MTLGYLVSAICFIFGIKYLSSIRTARKGNLLAALGMLLAIAITLFHQGILRFELILVGVIVGSLIGIIASKLVKMTAMPQMVALFNGFGGAASALVATSEYIRSGFAPEISTLITILLGTFIGAKIMAVRPKKALSVRFFSPAAIRAPTSVMPDIALAPDMRGVCSVGGTFAINSNPRKIASTKINKAKNKPSIIDWLLYSEALLLLRD